ncbi:related to HypA-like protein [Cephalotrichum gorgonifer]|uniref:Related to HypA-like protein n=1 Tax=Cephalotrichum gorgonifer TaxID=2041049 RepID=A0AAE8MPX3_9PEZI|nr:related to HypA-like protein [Cephalotrichum gorgonifer]
MATPYKVLITPDNTGLLKVAQTPEVATKVSELIQTDLDTHHVFFNERGFHDHIVHHLLSLYGTGASPADIQAAYERNAEYQWDAKPTHNGLPDRLSDWDEAKKYLGRGDYYPDLFRFFQSELERLGWREGLVKYLFEGSERSDDLLRRMFAGLLHPIIQLMYGVEWEQPAIVAAALAQAAVHKDTHKDLFTLSDAAAAKVSAPMPAILDLFAEARANEKLKTYLTDPDGPNTSILITQGIDDTVALVKRVRIGEAELEERTAEMIHAAVLVASSAAAAGGGQGGNREPRYDFFLMHQVNLTPIFLTLNAQPWIPTEMKLRMLEYKIRSNIITYLAVGCPPLDITPVTSYKPRDETLVAKPSDLLPRFFPVQDDGHTIKLARSITIAQPVLEKYEEKDWAVIKGADTWLKLMYTVLDATEDPAVTRYIRGTGFEEAWEGIPVRK